MTNINKFKETLDLCNGAHNKKDVQGWETLHEFDNSSPNKDFDARVVYVNSYTRSDGTEVKGYYRSKLIF